MKSFLYVFDPTSRDEQSKVRGVGRYLQTLKENFPEWKFGNTFETDRKILINPFFNFLQLPQKLKRAAEKQIAIIHDLIPFQYPAHFPVGMKGKINVFLNKLALRNYDLIITDSEASKKKIQRILGIEPGKIRVIYPCLPKVFTEKAPIHPNPRVNMIDSLPSKFCIYVGDATWNKNLVNIAKAIKIINVTCIFVGKVFLSRLLEHPWQRELGRFMEEAKGDKRFIFTGFVPDEDLRELYAKATLNLLVSREEGFGFSYVEAASQQCPSVLSDIPVFRETSNGEGAFFAQPEDAQDIANNIGEIFFHEEVKKKLGRAAHHRSLSFASDGFRKSWFRTIEDIQ